MMRLSRFSPNTRSAIAMGASVGVGQRLFQAFTRNLGPTAGLLAGVVATAAVAWIVYALLEWSARRKPEQANG
jgi:hypothetical protein